MCTSGFVQTEDGEILMKCRIHGDAFVSTRTRTTIGYGFLYKSSRDMVHNYSHNPQNPQYCLEVNW